MAKYKWDYQELLDNCRSLEKLQEVEKNLENKELMIKFLENYKQMLKLIRLKNLNKSTSINDKVILRNNDTSKSFGVTVHYYSEDLISLMEPVLDSYSVVKDIKRPRNISNFMIHLPNSKLIDFTSLFFKKSGSSYIRYKYFDAFSNPNFLNISYSNKLDDARGFTLLDPFLRKKYVNLIRNNTLVDLAILPHEMFHYIINDYDSGIRCNEICDLLSEIDGGFADILYSQFHEKYSIYNKEFFKNHTIYSFCYQIGVLAIRILITNSLDEDGKINYNELNNRLKEHNIDIEINDDNYLLFLKDPDDYLMRYAIGFLVGLDIFYNYQEDKDEAINSLISIRNSKDSNDIIKLLRDNGVTFMDDGYKNLKKYLKS